MTVSSEMRAVTPATLQDVKEAVKECEDRITKRQDKYEADCETDRKMLRKDVENVHVIATRVEEKIDKQNERINPFIDMFKGIFANPKIQTALITMILAAAGYVTWKVNNLITTAPQQPQQQIIVIPQSHQDGGTSLKFE